MNVTKREEIEALAQKLRGTPIDVLINNAGVAYDEHLGLDTQVFGTSDFSLGETIFATNFRGPLMVTQAFIEHVKASRQKKVVCVSSTTGSLTHSLPGTGGIFYRSSKAALNRAMMSVAGAVKSNGVTLVLMHPGAVATERNLLAAEHFAKGQVAHFDLITPTLSAHHMITTIGQLKIADSGRFFNYDGSTAPW